MSGAERGELEREQERKEARESKRERKQSQMREGPSDGEVRAGGGERRLEERRCVCVYTLLARVLNKWA